MTEDEDLTSRIDSFTHHQVRNLKVIRTNNQIMVVGQCGTYYVKQLVSQAVFVLLPDINVNNDIEVR